MPPPKMNAKEQEAYDEALRRIEECRLKGKEGTDLNLIGLGLTMLPPQISQLMWLLRLHLNENQLTTLPPEIAKLTALQALFLQRNQLTTLPPEICQLTALTVLSLQGNKLTTLPPEIAQLTELRDLSLNSNQLTALPPEFVKLSLLWGLHLDNNPLTTLPPEIVQLSALMELDLSGNQLTTLPPEIGRLVNLERLNLEDNALRELPESLKGLSKLRALFLHGNDALGLPAEVLGQIWFGSGPEKPPAKPQEILRYYFAQREGKRRPLNEVKVLVVGESEVGKTSLIRQLRGEAHDPKQDKTHGIERHRVPMKCGRLGDVRLNVWDFGGQDIMHATHQFFLTRRSVYLLVLDSRQNERQSRIDYWLRLIASFGGDSPVIVVCNKADQQVMQLNWTGLQREYPQIAGFAKEVCCYHYGEVDRRRGLDELKEQIAEAVANDVKEVDKPILESWLDLKDELETDGRPFISLQQYHRLAKTRGIKTKEDREILLTLMHGLGSVLHFSEHAIFEKERDANAAPADVEELNVLDPGWVTEAIYKLLNDATLIRAGGVMTRGDMRRSLAELPGGSERYPKDKEDFIIAMMRRFEICFPFDGEADRWFLPDLLHKDEVDTGDWKEALGFRYKYTVLPTSVMGRLMVRLHWVIANRCLWRTGAKFKRGACEALVRSEPEDARVDIRIRGGDGRARREFLAVIREALAAIHASFSGNLAVEEKVPVPGQEEAFLDYETLLLLEGNGTATTAVKVNGQLVTVNVMEALDGVTEENARLPERLRLERKGFLERVDRKLRTTAEELQHDIDRQNHWLRMAGLIICAVIALTCLVGGVFISIWKASANNESGDKQSSLKIGSWTLKTSQDGLMLAAIGILPAFFVVNSVLGNQRNQTRSQSLQRQKNARAKGKG